MKVETAFLCDSVQELSDQRLNLLGVYAALAVTSFPWYASDLTVVAVLRIEPGDGGRIFQVSTTVKNPNQLVIISGLNQVQVDATNPDSLVFVMVRPEPNSPAAVESPGSYAIDIQIDYGPPSTFELAVKQSV